MEIGEGLKPMKGYKEITIRNYATLIGKEMGRSYSVRKDDMNRLTIIRNS